MNALSVFVAPGLPDMANQIYHLANMTAAAFVELLNVGIAVAAAAYNFAYNAGKLVHAIFDHCKTVFFEPLTIFLQRLSGYDIAALFLFTAIGYTFSRLAFRLFWRNTNPETAPIQDTNGDTADDHDGAIYDEHRGGYTQPNKQVGWARTVYDKPTPVYQTPPSTIRITNKYSQPRGRSPTPRRPATPLNTTPQFSRTSPLPPGSTPLRSDHLEWLQGEQHGRSAPKTDPGPKPNVVPAPQRPRSFSPKNLLRLLPFQHYAVYEDVTTPVNPVNYDTIRTMTPSAQIQYKQRTNPLLNSDGGKYATTFQVSAVPPYMFSGSELDTDTVDERCAVVFMKANADYVTTLEQNWETAFDALKKENPYPHSVAVNNALHKWVAESCALTRLGTSQMNARGVIWIGSKWKSISKALENVLRSDCIDFHLGVYAQNTDQLKLYIGKKQAAHVDNKMKQRKRSASPSPGPFTPNKRPKYEDDDDYVPGHN